MAAIPNKVFEQLIAQSIIIKKQNDNLYKVFDGETNKQEDTKDDMSVKRNTMMDHYVVTFSKISTKENKTQSNNYRK